MDYDVVIVGAGASGLVAAISAARKGSSVLVIEQKDKAGKKILATGNGKCNFTNMLQLPECYRSYDSAFAMKVLSCFDVSRTIRFFEELGIYPKERNGYLYPNSEQAASVVQVLTMECERLGVTFSFGEHVQEIISPNFTIITKTIIDSESLKLKASGKKPNKGDSNNSGNNNGDKKTDLSEIKTYFGRNLILAAGGCATPKLGSDGSGYLLAEGLGHTIIKPLPALVQLKSSEKYCKTLSGVRTNAMVKAFTEETLLAEEVGEILFTDYGISGIPIMQISRFASKALDFGNKVTLKIDVLPETPIEEVKLMIKRRIQQNPDKTIEQMMVGLFNQKLSYIIILEAGLNPSQKTGAMTQPHIDAVARQIKEFKMVITDTNSFENAQVCAGGVSTKEIQDNTLESKLVSNLFITGELIDVDGTCGGYNLQWAWSTGFLAGAAAGNNSR